MRKHLKFGFLVLLAALFLWWFGRGLDWATVRRTIVLADWKFVAAAVGLICLSFVFRALRWRALLRPLAPAKFGALFAATTVGFGALFLLGRPGEVLRPAFLPLKDPRVGPGASFVTIGVERIYDLAAVVILFAVNLLFFRPETVDDAQYGRLRTAGALMLCAVAAGVVALAAFRRYAQTIIGAIEKALSSRPAYLRRPGQLLVGLSKQLADALGVLIDARELALTVGWTALLWSCSVGSTWLLLRAFDLPFGLGAAVFLLGWAVVGSLVPTPGGAAGAFHATAAAGLISLGVEREQSAAIAIVMHLAIFSPATFFGLYYFLRGDVSLARLRQMVFAEDEPKAFDGLARTEVVER